MAGYPLEKILLNLIKLAMMFLKKDNEIIHVNEKREKRKFKQETETQNN